MRGQFKRFLFITLLAAAFAGLLAACEQNSDEGDGGTETAATQDGKEVVGAPGRSWQLNVAGGGITRIGFVYSGPLSDVGEVGAQEEARKALDALPNVNTLVRDSIPANETAQIAIDEMVNEGCTVIVGTSYRLMNCLYDAARRHPDIQFLQCQGYKTRPNLSVFFGRMYEARYLTGMVAGLMTSSGIVGYVAAVPLPEVICELNAFALGVMEVNPQAQVRVAWTNSWDNPTLERQTALALIKIGADVLAQHQDSLGVQAAAEERGVHSIGYNTDMSKFAPHAHLTAAVFHWQAFYDSVVKQLRQGTFKSGMFWPGMSDGVVDIALYSDAVPKAVRQRVDKRRREIIAGDFVVFTGPVYDQSGLQRIPAGQAANDRELLGMNWLAKGVAGGLE